MTPDQSRRERDRLIIGMGALSLLAVFVTIVVSYTTLHNRAQLINQATGRRIVVTQTCAVEKAIIDAGLHVLESSVLLPGDRVVNGRFFPGPVSRSLGPNYPSYAERLRIARASGNGYESGIVKAVIREVHEAGIAQVPIRNGHLDCRIFARELEHR